MSRVRSLNPSATLDEDVASLSIHARYAWAYLPCYADRAGRMKDAPFTLNFAIFPADAVDMDAILEELARARHIIRYEAEGGRWIQIRSFDRYQHPHARESESTIPAPLLNGAARHPPERSEVTAIPVLGHALNGSGTALAMPSPVFRIRIRVRCLIRVRG